MNLTKTCFAVAAVLALAVALITSGIGIEKSLEIVSIAGLALTGVVVVTYNYPVSGLTAPTVVQTGPNGFNEVTATVFMADTDTTASIIHNWGLSAAQVAALQPLPTVAALNPGTAAAILSWNLANTNIAVLNKVSAAGSGGTFGVWLLRPNTLIQ